MPRRSSGASHAPPPVVQGGGSISTPGLGATLAEGIAFGSGSAIAHRAVDAMMGPRVIQHETVVSGAPAAAPASNVNGIGGSDACGIQSKAFQDCLNNYSSDISKCQFYLDMLSECRKNHAGAMGA
uniref:CHCH domain-containing protein n=1 Tax=Nelumbo nucifera TaxID=4432 RepID=A0A822XSL5_NELNU|nr:TPA_asm: hypothetical protein HUJ06_023624 [Nelumbo nucifera]